MRTHHHLLSKILVSGLVVPALGLIGVGANQPNTVQAAGVNVVTKTDNYRSPTQQPEYKAVPKKYRSAIPVQFLGINDLHGGLSTTGDVQIGSKTYKDAGTVARMASYLNIAQNHFKKVNKSNNTFRVEAGDMVGAAPANSSLLAHESTMHVLRAMNFKIGTLGNHEFDRGLAEFNRILTGAKPAATADKLVKNYPHQASKIDLIDANVIRKTTNKPPYGYQPYTIRTVKAHGQKAKVGFIGIDTTDLPHLTLYNNYKAFKLLDEAKTIVKYDKVLNKKGVKAVVVLAHTGVASENGKTTGDVVDILKKVNQIDPKNNVGLYVAGHSHQYANAVIGKTRVVQAVYTGKAYDDTQGYINPKTGKFVGLTSHVYPVLSKKADKKVKSNAKVAAIVKDADKRVAPKVNEVIGKAGTNKPITGRLHNTSTMENAAGELVVDGQLYEAKKAGTNPDFAMTNTGGIRADLDVKSNGDITWGAATAVQPFGNILQVVTMTGKQIEAALNQQYDENQHYYLQISGLKYTYTDTGNKDQPYKVVKMTKENGEPISSTGTYRVVINDFLHGGGDNFFAFKNTPIVGSIGSDTDVFVNYIKDMKAANTLITAPKLDRKVYQKAGSAKQAIIVALPIQNVFTVNE
ncbi:bifunctional metallophosphatase/5'-nucleotidase [Lentilactobacillus diolivorans]|uniref:Bifunctional metallophosphatase/5'-nucleotidase n=1 Tax=Lentilactobacillus diolivorans TaxID=179838 RepID=A0ABQ0XA48_9LACO|nr:bifunctional metallophosphatase/5'-nucleotidase [Lentilactobacillus diolivorans]GEP22948.1 bifunctional metallophosphatase/5'-nucleotidase [Lentilactobacillus diolivorans]